MFGENRQLTFKNEARKKLLAGVNILYDAVSPTLGPRGRNVIIERGYSDPKITKDGVSVAQEIFVEDDIENVGIQIMKTIARKTADDSGDGTTTSTILGKYIFENGLKAVEDGYNPVLLKRELDEASAKIIQHIKNDLAIPVKGNVETLKQIATISANNDSVVGNLIGDIYTKLPTGQIIVDDSPTESTYSEVYNGCVLDNSFVDSMFYTSENFRTKDYNDAYIAVTNLKLSTLDDVQHVVSLALSDNKALIIICEELKGEALDYLVYQATKNSKPIAAISAPSLAQMRRMMLEDIAIITGGAFIDRNKSYSLRLVKSKHLGTAEKVIVGQSNTIIFNPGGDKEKIAARKKHILEDLVEGHKDKNLRKRHLEARVHKLFEGVAKIYVGATTEFEQKEKFDRIEDAVCATRASISDGIVPGGATVFTTVSKGMTPANKGEAILKDALIKPLYVLLSNAAYDESTINSIVAKITYEYGYNGETEQFENLLETGVIDPAKVLISALQNAVSVAGTLLLTDVVINYKSKENTI